MVSVYAIECHANGCAYIGCTKGKIGKRMREHRCLLNQRKHTASKMVADWHRFGSGAFSIRVLESLPDSPTIEAKRACELKWMNDYSAEGRLYNAHLTSFAPTPEAMAKGQANSQLYPGNRWSSEANAKRSLAQLGIPKGHGAKISATKQARKVMR
jgi:hypothetical protein